MSNYRKNKHLAITYNTDPTMTDQSQANDTDINVIVKRYQVTGMAPGAAKKPTYEDFSGLPTTLADAFEMARSQKDLQQQLPAQLRNMSVEQLVGLKPEELTRILTPPADPPATQAEVK